jgi:hypothetical protein
MEARELQRFRARAGELLGKDVLRSSGFLFVSPAASLRPSPVYLLGHNPGGDPAELREDTVGRSLDDLLGRQAHHKYRDEAWKVGGRVRPPGGAPLQKRAWWLLEKLVPELPTEQVPCSNLIFVRSRSVEQLPAGHAERCWQVHQLLIEEVVRPRVILVFGNSRTRSPFQFLLERWGSEATAKEERPSGHGRYCCRRFHTPSGMGVVGLPHLSRYDITRHPGVVDWIREGMAGRP